MKIKLLKNVVAGGKPQKKGTVIDVKESDARYLISAGSAEPAPVAKKDKE